MQLIRSTISQSEYASKLVKTMQKELTERERLTVARPAGKLLFFGEV